MSVFAFRWYSAQTLTPFPERTVMSSVQGFCSWCWKLLFAGPLGLKLSLLSIFCFYHVHKSFYLGCVIWFSYSFYQTTKSLYNLPFSNFTFQSLYNFAFLLVMFLVCSLSWLVPFWLVCFVSKKLCFLSRQYCPFIWYHC